MDETQYKATAGKTFLYFIIYTLVSQSIFISIIKFVIPYIYIELLETAVNSGHIKFWISFIIGMVLFAITIPLLRKLIIKLHPSGILSSNNALLYLSLVYLLSSIFLPMINFEYDYSLINALAPLVFIYYLSLFFYFKHKSKTIEVINYDNKNV